MANSAKPDQTNQGTTEKVSRQKPPPTLLVVTLSLAVMTVFMIAGLTSPGRTTKETQATNDLKNIATAFERYNTDVGEWPRHACQSPNSFSSAYLAGYSCLFDNVYQRENWDGPYMSPLIPSDAVFVTGEPCPGVDPADPWGECYMVYRFKGGRYVSIVCKGPDRTVNTDLEGILAGKPIGDDQIVTLYSE